MSWCCCFDVVVAVAVTDTAAIVVAVVADPVSIVLAALFFINALPRDPIGLLLALSEKDAP